MKKTLLIVLLFCLFLISCKENEEVTKVTITFHTEEVSTITLTNDEIYDYKWPDNPIKEGYLFQGWYTDKDCTSGFTSFEDYLGKEVNLYPKWKEIIMPKEEDTVNPMIIYQGSKKNPTYETDSEIDLLEGMMAIDNIDGDITDRIIVDSPDFDVTKPGTYYVFYSVTDTAGNSSESFVRTFTIKQGYDGVIISEGKVNGVNSIRQENYMVYYTYEAKGNKTTANQWGYEISINSEGYVVEVNTQVTMLVGGSALSGIGINKEKLTNVKVGDIVYMNKDPKTNERTFTIVRNSTKSNIFQINLFYDQALAVINEAYNAGIDYDEDLASDYLSEIQEIKEEVLTDDSNISSKAKRVEELTNNLIYMTTYTKDTEIRAVWHRPNSTVYEGNLEGIINLLDKFQTIGINTVFLETFWNGYASYRSEILETHPTLASFSYGEYGNDYIIAFLSEANKRNIAVHAWCHVFNAGSKNLRSSIVKDSMLLEDYEGNLLHPNGYGGAYYYDPSNTEVIEMFENVFTEMATKYSFSGIQYDYIRYYDNNYGTTPIRDSGYGKSAEEKFKTRYGLTGDVRELILDLDIRAKWNEWRMSNITNAVQRFTSVIKKINPSLIISADVVSPIFQAKSMYMQDWLTWVNNGYLDMICPMIYTGSSEAIASASKVMTNQIGKNALLVSGIAPIYYGYSLMINHLELEATNYASGYAYFASHNLIGNTEAINSMIIGKNRKEIISPFDDFFKVKNFVINKMISRINDIYLKRELISDDIAKDITNKLQSIILLEDMSLTLEALKDLTFTNLPKEIQETMNKDIENLITILEFSQVRKDRTL